MHREVHHDQDRRHGRPGSLPVPLGARSAAAPRDTARLLEEAEQLARMGIWEWDVASDRIVWSRGLRRLHGVSEAEAPPSFDAFLERVFPEDRRRVQQVVERARRTGEPYELRFRTMLHGGGTRWLQARARTDLDPVTGEVRRIHGFTQDITDDVRAEEALAHSEQRYRTLVADVRDYAILLLDADGNIQTWNKGAERIKGCSAREAVGRHFSTFYTEEDRRDGRPWRLLAAAARDGSVEDEGWRVRNDGSRFWADVVITALHDAEGRLTGYSKVTRDLTARKRAEEELARSNRDLEQFAYAASHDLREPLRTVSSFLRLLETRHGGKLDPEAEEFIAEAIAGAQRMDALVQGLLAYARVRSSGRPLVPFPTEDALDLALANLRLAMEERSARVERGLLPRVLADPQQLTQLFQNLLENALKFQPPGRLPVVQVGARRDGPDHSTTARMWRFEVRDNGIGLAAMGRERMFGVFQRQHGATEFPGTGIGLALCKRIVERHGGRIGCDSDGPGTGATFWFTLPDAQNPDHASPGAGASAHGASPDAAAKDPPRAIR